MLFSHTESSGKFPKHRLEVHHRTVVGTNLFGIEQSSIEVWLELQRQQHSSTYSSYSSFHCSRLVAKPEFFKNMFETPRGWANVICHASSQQYLDKILLHGLIAGGIGQERRQTSMLLFGRAFPEKQGSI